MTEEDPDLLAGDNLDELRGRNPMSERFRLWQELENAKYQNNLLAQRCRELEQERDEARRYSCDLEARIIVLEEDRRDTSNKFGTNPCSEIILPDYPLAREPKEIAKQKGWDCFKDNA